MVKNNDIPEDVQLALRAHAERLIGKRPVRIQEGGRTKAAFFLRDADGEKVGLVQTGKEGRAQAAQLQEEILRAAWIEARNRQAAASRHSLAPASPPPVPAVASPPRRPTQEEAAPPPQPAPRPQPAAASVVLPQPPSTPSRVDIVVGVAAAVVAAAIIMIVLRAAVVWVAIASNASIMYHVIRGKSSSRRAPKSAAGGMQAVTPVSARRRPRTLTPMSVEAASPGQNWGAGPMDISPG